MAGIAGLLFVALTLPPLVIEAANLVASVPGWLLDLSELLNDRFGVDVNLSNLSTDVIDVQGALQNYAASLASGVLGIGTAVLGLLLQLLTMALFTLLSAGGRSSCPETRAVDGPARAPGRGGPHLGDRHRKDRWLRVLAGAVGAGLGDVHLCRAAGDRHSVRPGIAIWVGVISQFIPAVGTYLAAIVPILVALPEGLVKAIVVIIVLVVYQQIENLLISPRITARTMSLHPAVAFRLGDRGSADPRGGGGADRASGGSDRAGFCFDLLRALSR